ncbi:MAG: hypothetical protein LQ342_005559 [Letrouitia transgressa]|nr:MAG: hypothetical protein LQ342_005559 [Letrouitia transgressa]
MAHHQQTGHDRVHAAQDLSISNTTHATGSNHSVCEDDVPTEVDEPPDEQSHRSRVPSFRKHQVSSQRTLTSSSASRNRKASLLTQALLMSPDLTPASDAEAPVLTSDGGLTSPTRTNSPSPPLPATRPTSGLPAFAPKGLLSTDSNSEQRATTQPAVTHDRLSTDVEEGLGRRRCIKFACGRQPAPTCHDPPKPSGQTSSKPSGSETGGPQKRGGLLKFVCPAKPSERSQEPQPSTKTSNDQVTKAPLQSLQRSPSRIRLDSRKHRGSGSTIKSLMIRGTSKGSLSSRHRKRSNHSFAALEDFEATRFHEFAGPYNQEDEWVREQTAYGKKITVNDTLQKENAIRKLGEEVEEEALEEDSNGDSSFSSEDFDDEEERNDRSFMPAYDDSDGGNESDNEAGFADSDEDSEIGSEYQFWTPGLTTAATSTDHLEHIRPFTLRVSSDSSIESIVKGSGAGSRAGTKPPRGMPRPENDKMRPETPDLPDSTDFVCGTLDEDRPLEAAYMSTLKKKRQSRHRVIPQDIDPSFPTSDSEAESDDDDIVNASAHTSDGLMWLLGRSDEEDSAPSRRKISSRCANKSPMPSPKRLRSPPPPLPHKRGGIRRQSPARRVPFSRSPVCSSSHSIQQPKGYSPSINSAIVSPPSSHMHSGDMTTAELHLRPPPRRTTSLPKTPNPFWLKRNGESKKLSYAANSPTRKPTEIHSRGPIDIVKGLEKKRQRRKEKFWRQHCRNTSKDKDRRCQPGKGAERMRELGLEMAGKSKCCAPKVPLVLSI